LAATLVDLKKIVDGVVVLGPGPALVPRSADSALRFVALQRRASRPITVDSNGAPQGGRGLTHTPKSKTELLCWDYGHLTIAGAEFIAALLKRLIEFFYSKALLFRGFPTGGTLRRVDAGCEPTDFNCDQPAGYPQPNRRPHGSAVIGKLCQVLCLKLRSNRLPRYFPGALTEHKQFSSLIGG
jgi:hypothetical protein